MSGSPCVSLRFQLTKSLHQFLTFLAFLLRRKCLVLDLLFEFVHLYLQLLYSVIGFNKLPFFILHLLAKLFHHLCERMDFIS